MSRTYRATLLMTTALSFLFCGVAQASGLGTAEAIEALQAQVDVLQKQLTQLQKKQDVRTSKVSSETQTKTASKKEFFPGVSFTPGGYLAAEAVWRDKNQTTGVGSNFNRGIPFYSERDAHHDEFRGSVQSTRLSLLAEGKPTEDTSLDGYLEIDFQGSATTSTGTKTNSYVPRLRHAYMTLASEEWGGYILAGQAFSLATSFKSGLTPRKESGLKVIDASTAPGYVFTRAPSLRVVKSFADNKAHLGLSFEGAYTYTGGITTPTGVTISNAGTGSFANNNYSLEYAPDVIAKFAYDSDYGHYEVFGLTRFFRDIVGTSNFHKNYAMGLGGGASAYVPLISKKLELVANFIGGRGVGRYAVTGMPDVAFTPSGDIKPITQLAGSIGLVGHPTPAWDIYLYAGAEKVMRQDYSDTSYGYGSSLIDNSGCYTQGGTCTAQTEMVYQLTPGFWTQLYKGNVGTMKFGAQYSYTRRNAFSGLNNQAPHADENTVMFSFRYYPF